MFDAVLQPLHKPAVKGILMAAGGSPRKREHLSLLGLRYQEIVKVGRCRMGQDGLEYFIIGICATGWGGQNELRVEKL